MVCPKILPDDGCTNTIYYPLPKKFKPNTTRNDFIDLTDILPTILDITDIKYPEKINSR